VSGEILFTQSVSEMKGNLIKNYSHPKVSVKRMLRKIIKKILSSRKEIALDSTVARSLYCL
jgi:hypothetical protein